MIKIFDPEGIKPSKYKTAYPELDRTPEFEGFRGEELMFFWYFANKTSPIIDVSEEKRVEEAIKLSGLHVEPDVFESMVALNFSEDQQRAINKMSSYLPGPRYFAWKASRNLFKQYQEIANMEATEFTKTEGRGEDARIVTDYEKYINVTSKAAAAFDGLIKNLEEGFGTNKEEMSEEEEQGANYLRFWHENR